MLRLFDYTVFNYEYSKKTCLDTYVVYRYLDVVIKMLCVTFTDL